jgi:hypothetical protein
MKVLEPFRATRSYVQKIQARPEKVFALLCPVREAEWVQGWDPIVVYSRSGLAEPECVFLTGEGEPDSVWVVTRRDWEKYDFEIIKVTPWTTVAKINISLRPNDEEGTDAEVTYSYTALSEEGREFVNSYTEDYYREFMEYWEAALNEYFQSRKD